MNDEASGGMSDDFMASGWRRPPPQFARQLREQLRTADARPAMARIAGLPATACAAALLAGLSLLSFPQVRAGAAAFLDLFRVETFTAVPVQRERIQSLMSSGLDLKGMIGESVQVQKASGPMQRVDTPEEAAKLAKLRRLVPGWLPGGLDMQHVDVVGDQRLSVTARVARLQQLLETQGIHDLSIPEGVDGQVIQIYIPPAVHITYGGTAGQVTFLAARRPEAGVPAGLDVARLAEIGLRVLGIESAEAYRIAQSIDWRTTLLVPVPADATSFRPVSIQGQGGLLIESVTRRSPAPRALVLWSSGEEVLALAGNVDSDELLHMAQSVQ